MPPPTTLQRIDDRALMAVGIPGFGTLIPILTGLYGDLAVADPRLWAGAVWFVGLAAVIWLGNRWLLLRQRQHFDWFRHPLRRLVLLIAGVVLYTAPVTAGWLALWYLALGWPVDVGIITVVSLCNTICVLFVTHLYETLFLLRERIDDATRLDRLERARTEAQLQALRQQLDPHFLFNSLNTLSWLIETRPDDALAFTDALSDVYRYILSHRERDLVPLDEELAFLASYVRLLELRFGDAVQVCVGEPHGAWVLPPLSLQVLVENAVKHNAFAASEPLRVDVLPGQGEVVVQNPRRTRQDVETSLGVGLDNLAERVQLVLGAALTVNADDHRFEVRVPLLEVA